MAKTSVVVVDDSALMRRLLSTVLTQEGHEVTTARNGREGVERLVEWQPDVVTLDINMPQMDGLTALSLMMQARPTPVVMVSTLTERGADTTLKALELGAVDFVAKPKIGVADGLRLLAEDITDKVRTAAQAHVRRLPPAAAAPAAGPGATAATGAGAARRGGRATRRPAPTAAGPRC